MSRFVQSLGIMKANTLVGSCYLFLLAKQTNYCNVKIVSSHIDGSLCTWPLKATAKPQLLIYPHAKPTKDGKLETCKPIHKLDLKTTRNGFVLVNNRKAKICFLQ